MDESPLTFRPDPRELPEIEIRVNFGMFAGREATHAEVDDLARDLLVPLRRVSVVSLRRHELDDDAEATVHQVKVEARAADAREPGADLEERLVELVDAWARRAIADRPEVAEVDALPEPTM